MSNPLPTLGWGLVYCNSETRRDYLCRVITETPEQLIREYNRALKRPNGWAEDKKMGLVRMSRVIMVSIPEFEEGEFKNNG